MADTGIWNPDKQLKAWNFASRAHQGQLVPGTDIAYLNHIGTVAMEAMAAVTQSRGNSTGTDSKDIERPDLLIQCALLHDVIEDTDHTYDQVKAEFGMDVADGVLALSKDKDLPTKKESMADSLARIKKQPAEVWMVKLCDRITNLQPPPKHWDKEKINSYKDEANLILEELGTANQYLADRLRRKISQYPGRCL